MAMLSRGSAITTDRVIFVPENEGAHFFQIVSTNEELRFQRFTTTGKPAVDTNKRFVGDRGDDANVETFLVLCDPFTANVAALTGEASVAQQTVRITKPIRALDDMHVQGTLHACNGVHLGGNAYITPTGTITGAPLVHVEGDVRADGVVRAGTRVYVGNLALSEDLANGALHVDANLHVAGSELKFGAQMNTGLEASTNGFLNLVVNNSKRVAVGPASVRVACALAVHPLATHSSSSTTPMWQ
jgi:hypothetical protein